MMEISKAIGIDLGTTHSRVSIMNETDSEIILYKDKNGVGTTPSCVWYDSKKKQIVVGKQAFRRRGSLPEPIKSIKRKMGTTLLTPLGNAGEIPENIPDILKKILQETRTERLERYLSRMEEINPKKLEEKKESERKNPPLLWILDQTKRQEEYIKSLTKDMENEKDKEARNQILQQINRIKENPPLLWLPEEISSLILAEEMRQIKELMEERYKNSIDKPRVDRAVITVPAYFGTLQVEATKEAGYIAGLQVLDLLQEPTASAIYYCWKYKLEDGIFFIFDMGGGTFDVSIVRRTFGRFEVLAISGDRFLGGDDIDFTIAEWIREKIINEDSDYQLNLNPQIEEDRAIRNCFILVAEGVKKALTHDSEVWIRDSNTVKDKEGKTVNIEMTMNRNEFENLVSPLIERCMPKCYEALAKARKKTGEISLKDIDQIFLVGGATHTPLIQKFVKERFCQPYQYNQEEIQNIIQGIKGDNDADTQEIRKLAEMMLVKQEHTKCKEPLKHDPDLCVSMGAGIHAASYGVEEHSEKVYISFLGERGTREKYITIMGAVKEKTGNTLQGAYAKLLCKETRLDIRCNLDSRQEFKFQKVSLQENVHNHFYIYIFSSNNEELGKAQYDIEQNSNYETTGGGHGPTLPKAISMDVEGKGEITRDVILESGIELPVEAERLYKVPNYHKGIVHFQLYEGRAPLKIIVAVLDLNVPAGTGIHFKFFVSEDRLMRCKYKIGDGQEESAIIEPPLPRSKPQREDIISLNKKIQDSLTYKPLAERRIFEIRQKKLNQTIEDAYSAGDEAQLIDALDELENLYQEIVRYGSVLSPAWEEFEKEFSQCLNLLNTLKNIKPNYPVEETDKNLKQVHKEAEKAYKEKDQELYGEYYQRVHETLLALQKVIQDIEAPPPSLTLEERASQALNELINMSDSLKNAAKHFAIQFDTRAQHPQENDSVESNQKHAKECREFISIIEDQDSQLKNLLNDCQKKPKEVLSECSSIYKALEDCHKKLLAKQDILLGKTKKTKAGSTLPDDFKPPAL